MGVCIYGRKIMIFVTYGLMKNKREKSKRIIKKNNTKMIITLITKNIIITTTILLTKEDLMQANTQRRSLKNTWS